MNKVLWLDVDGVLLDYTRPFLMFAELDKKGVHYDNLFDYDLRKLFDDEDHCLSTMLAFAMSENFSSLPAIADPNLLVALRNVGYELRIITKLPAPNRSKVNRVLNLSAYFGAVFDEIVFTGSTDCKVEYLSQRKLTEPFKQYTIIEDNPEFLSKVEARGFVTMNNEFETFGIAHPYNKTVADNLMLIPMASSFDEVARVLIDRSV